MVATKQQGGSFSCVLVLDANQISYTLQSLICFVLILSQVADLFMTSLIVNITSAHRTYRHGTRYEYSLFTDHVVGCQLPVAIY